MARKSRNMTMNQKIARDMERVLRRYQVDTASDTPDATTLADLLADLMIWAASTEIDFDEALFRARTYADTEIHVDPV